jgi:hypothetical protein
MNKKVKLGLAILVVLVLLSASVFEIACRLNYGTWLPFGTPLKVEYNGRTYSNGDYREKPYIEGKSYRTFTINTEPAYNVPRSLLDIITGKQFYMTQRESTLAPTVIYLYVKDNKFLPFELSGGP